MPPIGSKLGLYEITALLRKGGMGEVYRGRDTKVKRDVAIKVTGFGANKQENAVSRDGRFLIIQQVGTSGTAPITLILNWRPPKP